MNPADGPRQPTPFGLEREPSRVVAFTDGLIAIAVTLLVLEIRPPQDSRHLLRGLAALWPSYMAYGITFMLIGQIWVNHHVMFDHIRRADRLVLFLNTLLLMDVALMPFTTAVLAQAFRDGAGQRIAVVVDGLAFLVAAVLFNTIWLHAVRGRLLSDNIHPSGIRAIRRRFGLAVVWLAAGTLLGGFQPTIGVAVIAAFIPYYWLPIRGEVENMRRRQRRGSDTA